MFSFSAAALTFLLIVDCLCYEAQQDSVRSAPVMSAVIIRDAVILNQSDQPGELTVTLSV